MTENKILVGLKLCGLYTKLLTIKIKFRVLWN